MPVNYRNVLDILERKREDEEPDMGMPLPNVEDYFTPTPQDEIDARIHEESRMKGLIQEETERQAGIEAAPPRRVYPTSIDMLVGVPEIGLALGKEFLFDFFLQAGTGYAGLGALFKAKPDAKGPSMALDFDAANQAIENAQAMVEPYLGYTPRTDTARKGMEIIHKVFALFDKLGEMGNQGAYEWTESPSIATAVGTTLKMLPMIIAWGVMRSVRMGRGKPAPKPGPGGAAVEGAGAAETAGAAARVGVTEETLTQIAKQLGGVEESLNSALGEARNYGVKRGISLRTRQVGRTRRLGVTPEEEHLVRQAEKSNSQPVSGTTRGRPVKMTEDAIARGQTMTEAEARSMWKEYKTEDAAIKAEFEKSGPSDALNQRMLENQFRGESVDSFLDKSGKKAFTWEQREAALGKRTAQEGNILDDIADYADDVLRVRSGLEPRGGRLARAKGKTPAPELLPAEAYARKFPRGEQPTPTEEFFMREPPKGFQEVGEVRTTLSRTSPEYVDKLRQMEGQSIPKFREEGRLVEPTAAERPYQRGWAREDYNVVEDFGKDTTPLRYANERTFKQNQIDANSVKIQRIEKSIEGLKTGRKNAISALNNELAELRKGTANKVKIARARELMEEIAEIKKQSPKARLQEIRKLQDRIEKIKQENIRLQEELKSTPAADTFERVVEEPYPELRGRDYTSMRGMEEHAIPESYSIQIGEKVIETPRIDPLNNWPKGYANGLIKLAQDGNRAALFDLVRKYNTSVVRQELTKWGSGAKRFPGIYEVVESAGQDALINAIMRADIAKLKDPAGYMRPFVRKAITQTLEKQGVDYLSNNPDAIIRMAGEDQTTALLRLLGEDTAPTALQAVYDSLKAANPMGYTGLETWTRHLMNAEGKTVPLSAVMKEIGYGKSQSMFRVVLQDALNELVKKSNRNLGTKAKKISILEYRQRIKEGLLDKVPKRPELITDNLRGRMETVLENWQDLESALRLPKESTKLGKARHDALLKKHAKASHRLRVVSRALDRRLNQLYPNRKTRISELPIEDQAEIIRTSLRLHDPEYSGAAMWRQGDVRAAVRGTPPPPPTKPMPPIPEPRPLPEGTIKGLPTETIRELNQAAADARKTVFKGTKTAKNKVDTPTSAIVRESGIELTPKEMARMTKSDHIAMDSQVHMNIHDPVADIAAESFTGAGRSVPKPIVPGGTGGVGPTPKNIPAGTPPNHVPPAGTPPSEAPPVLPKMHVYKKGVAGFFQRAFDKIDVMARFNRWNATNSGEAFKIFESVRSMEQEFARFTARQMRKYRVPKEQGELITRRAHNVLKEGEVPANVESAAMAVRQYFKECMERGKADGVLHDPWPHSQLVRNTLKIEELEQMLPLRKGPKAKAITDQIAELREINDLINKVQPEYVHIPLDQWFGKLREVLKERGYEESVADAIINRDFTSKFYRGRYFRQRTTVDMGGVIDWLKELRDPDGRPLFEPLDFDARMIMASYAQKLGAMRGIAKIFDAAQKDNLIIPKMESPPPGFTNNSGLNILMKFPDLGKYTVHEGFLNYLDTFMQHSSKGFFSNVFGITKMMAFYNPIFLPMYDMYQAVWSGAVKPWRPVQTAGYLYKGFKSARLRDAMWKQAADNGAFSQPYSAPLRTALKDMAKEIGKNDAWAKRIVPGNYLYDFYSVVWDMAWKGDQSIRMATYHYLMEKGFTPRQSGQYTALFHGDYARMTPQARSLANKIWFTPTFKYAMGNAQWQMIKSFAKVAREGIKMKGAGNIAAGDALLAKGLLGVVGTMAAKDLIMKYILGFEVDDTGLRYSKAIDTDQGKKELVMHMADPNNTILRLVHRWGKWGSDPERLAEFFSKAKWDVHPIWGLGIELLQGMRRDGRTIYNPFDSSGRIAADISLYSLQRIVQIFDWGRRAFSPSDREAQNSFSAMQKEFGTIATLFLYPVSFQYVRGTASQRKRREIRKLLSTYRSITTWRDKPKDADEYKRRMNAFYEELTERYEELKKLEQEGH